MGDNILDGYANIFSVEDTLRLRVRNLREALKNIADHSDNATSRSDAYRAIAKDDLQAEASGGSEHG